MSKVLTPELVKRAIYSKYLMERARAVLAEGSELSPAVAILSAHDSIEILMRVIADHLRAPLAPESRFKDFWKVIKDSTGKIPPRLPAMDRLNHQRNGFKHKGLLPNAAGVNDLLREAVAFCEEISRDYLDTDYQALSLADLLKNADVRERIKEAEQAKADGNLPEALSKLGIAMDGMTFDKQKSSQVELIGEFRTPHSISQVGQELGWSFSSDMRTMFEKLRKMAEVVDCFSLAIDPAKHRRFKWLTPLRSHTASGQVHVTWTRDPSGLTMEDFEFCYAFVVDFGLRSQ